MDLSVRANNCLESAKIQTVGELVKMTEADLLKVRSFGKTACAKSSASWRTWACPWA